MNSWVFLSKNGVDPYINMFAAGCGQQSISTQDFVYESSTQPIVLRGILKHKIMKRCWEDRRDFYYMDTGYFGNEPTAHNPQGWKVWHRIVKNNLQHKEIHCRPDDRFRRFNKTFAPWKKSGKKILVVAPDEKPCKFYGTDKQTWITTTINAIKQFTDRPVELRERPPNRIDRITTNTLKQALDDDVFAVVTYNSVAAVESVFYGIPAFTLALANAAEPVACQNLELIETPYYPDQDKLYAWACHLAYGQFHISELQDGSAQEILQS